jgi:hypothetical protein
MSGDHNMARGRPYEPLEFDNDVLERYEQSVGTYEDNDPVNHPLHYTDHPSGIECIQITEHMGFNLGNALKYIWRCDLKKDAIEDLEKAKWYIERELTKRRSK